MKNIRQNKNPDYSIQTSKDREHALSQNQIYGTLRMQSAPMMFWKTISPEQWKAMSDKEQDKLIALAKLKHATFDYSSIFKP